MDAYRNNDALDTPEMDAERARLDAEMDAERARLDAVLKGYLDQEKELEATVGKRRTNLRDAKKALVDVRILIGTCFIERLKPEITPYGEQTKYMEEKAREWGFKLSKAYDNMRYARLHQHDPDRYSSARLAELSVKDVRALHSQLGDDQVAIGRVRERLTAQDADNAVEVAALFIARTDQRDLRRMAGLQQQGVKTKAFRGWIAGAVMRRGEPMTEEERSRGLSKLMVDSGAYTESRRGIGIDIDRYCAQLSANPWIKTYANLDKIDPDLPEAGATVSHRNFRYMRERGLDPMPVYHDRERIYWLEKYIHEEGCSYIGLGDVAGSTVQRNRVFFDRCFKVIRNAGRPIKVHAFGVAHESTLMRILSRVRIRLPGSKKHKRPGTQTCRGSEMPCGEHRYTSGRITIGGMRPRRCLKPTMHNALNARSEKIRNGATSISSSWCLGLRTFGGSPRCRSCTIGTSW